MTSANNKSKSSPGVGAIKRILYIDHTAKLGGGEFALLNLVQHLDRNRFEPIVLLSADGPLGDMLDDAGIETHIIPLDNEVVQTRKESLGVSGWIRFGRISRTLGYIRKVRKFIKATGPDVVHTNSLKADIIGGIAANLAGVPVIWHVRDRIAEDYLPGPAVKIFRLLCRVIPKYVIANSRATLETLHLPKKHSSAAVYSGFVERSRVVHDGVSQIPGEDATWVSPGYPLIGLVGRLSPWKGQHIFIEAAAEVIKRHPNARFQIIGSAMFGEEEYESKIRTQVNQLGLSGAVEFTGFRSDVPEMIQKLDILVHASTSGEPFGQVVIEGMACGRPVVATNGGGVPEIVQDGITGILIPMNDSASMAKAINYLLDNPAAAREMGAAGYRRVRDKFMIERTVQKVQSIYYEICGCTNPAGSERRTSSSRLPA